MMWNFLYWVLLVIAVVLLLRGLLWDRAGFRGRAKRRCRRCWYDLTGSDDVSRGAVVCPECGKGHKTVRSMRRTRRRKRWIAAAVVVWLMAYGASVTPKVQKNGWGAAVPRVVLVASMPFLSDAQGSGLSEFVLSPNASNATGFDRFVLKQFPPIDGYIFQFNKDQAKTSFGWVSRRIAFLLARFESQDVLTDGTTARGRAFKSILSQFVGWDYCYDFEAEWAKKQVTIEIDIQNEFGPNETPIGFVRMRRMILSPYRVRFGMSGSTYQGYPPSTMRINGIMPNETTPEGIRAHWVGRFLWDSLDPVGRVYGDRRGAYTPGYMLPTGAMQSPRSALSKIGFSFYEYAGEDGAGLRDDANWKYDASLTREVLYGIDPRREIAADNTIEFEDQIKRLFSVKLGVEYEQQKERWVPVIRLERNSTPDSIKDNIVFGGNLEVVATNPQVVDTGGASYMRGMRQTYWAWGRIGYTEAPVKRDGQLVTEARRIESAHKVIQVQSGFSDAIPGQLSGNYWALRRHNTMQTKLVLRMSYTHQGNYYDFGGLWGDRVFEGVLELEIEDWTIDELRQFMVNGIVPDHAMP